jgi:hypothetical protein
MESPSKDDVVARRAVSFWRLKVAGKPTHHVRFHRIGRDSYKVRVIAAGLN